MLKLTVYIPENHLEEVKQALFDAGAGCYPRYDCCCWQVAGVGQFRPLKGSSPFVGRRNQVEEVREYRVEMLCRESLVPAVETALRRAHPYEEPAYDFVKVRVGGGVFRSRGRLAVEFVAIYVVLPLALTLSRLRLGGFPVLPVLWLASAPAALWLLGHGFRWHDFFGWNGLKLVWRGVLLRTVFAGIMMLLLVLAIEPDWLWHLPRANPRLWLLIMFFYPLLSVYPQGILYRALYYRRYARLFGQGWTARLVGAAAFSFCHVFFLNPLALVLTLVGGWFFCRTYERTRSLPVSNLEHALLGALLFTIGLGRFLYHGTQALFNG